MKTTIVFDSVMEATSESEARDRSNSVRRLLTLPKPKRAPECFRTPSLL